METLKKNKKLMIYLAKNDFRTKYAGSYFGIFWAFVQPLITILLYWFVFQLGFRSSDIENIPFVLWLMAGLIPWFYFSESVINGTNCFLEYNYLVKKVKFEIKILPIVKIMSSLFVHGFFVILLLVCYAIMGLFPGMIVIQLLYYSAAMILLSLAVCYLTSAIAVFFRDTTQIVGIIMQIGVWMTPIMWQFETMPLPGWLKQIFKLNPMFYIVQGYRDTMIGNVWFFERWKITIYFWVFTILLFVVSRKVYQKLKPHFADVL